MSQNRKIIMYDGGCALCNWFVEAVLFADRDRKFFFLSQQSEKTAPLLLSLGYKLPILDSVILLDESSQNIFVKSEAVFEVAKQLGGIYQGLRIFRVLPRRMNDYLYDFVAKNRYRVFGKYSVCPLPKAQDRHRFL